MADDSDLLASERLLAVLRCPESGQGLRRATAEELSRFPGPPADGLIRDDGTLLYPVRDGFPILLKAEALRPLRG